MPSINLDIHVLEHPKLLRLDAVLGAGSVLFLIRLWLYVAKTDPEGGRIRDLTAEQIEGVIGWKEQPGFCVDTLLTIGFLHRRAGGWQVHNWNKHAGHLKTYAERGRKAAEKRWKPGKSGANKRTSRETNRELQEYGDGCLKHTSSIASSMLQAMPIQSNTDRETDTLNARASPEISFVGKCVEIPLAVRQVAELPENLAWLGGGALLEWIRAGHPPDEIISAINKTSDARRKGKNTGVNYTSQILRDRKKNGYPEDSSHDQRSGKREPPSPRTRTGRVYQG